MPCYRKRGGQWWRRTKLIPYSPLPRTLAAWCTTVLVAFRWSASCYTQSLGCGYPCSRNRRLLLHISRRRGPALASYTWYTCRMESVSVEIKRRYASVTNVYSQAMCRLTDCGNVMSRTMLILFWILVLGLWKMIEIKCGRKDWEGGRIQCCYHINHIICDS